MLGALAILAIPLGVAASQLLRDVRLLESLVITVPIAFVLALVAISAARRARYRLERTVFRDRARTVRAARILAWTGMYLALTGALTLGVYGLLRWAS